MTAVLILQSGRQSFIDTDGVRNLARNAETVKLAHKGPMQRQYTLTLDASSCEIVTTIPSDHEDIMQAAIKARKGQG